MFKLRLKEDFGAVWGLFVGRHREQLVTIHTYKGKAEL